MKKIDKEQLIYDLQDKESSDFEGMVMGLFEKHKKERFIKCDNELLETNCIDEDDIMDFANDFLDNIINFIETALIVK